MYKKDERNQEVVFIYNDWTVRNWNIFDGSFVCHEPCQEVVESTLLGLYPRCYTCCVIVSNEVLGVWILLNFERIQEDAEPFKQPGGVK